MREALVTIDEAEFATLGIGELVSCCQTAGIRTVDELACHGNRSIIQVEVDTPIDEAQLQSLDYVDQWERISDSDSDPDSDSDDTFLYVIAFSIPEVSDSLAEHVADLVGTCDPDVTDDGATVSLVGSQETIAGTLTEYKNDGVTPELRKLGDYRGRDQALDELTDRQHDVIQTAYEMGYYDVPRSVSTADVAAELDLDPSTVAEHLQRAERNLLTYHLSSE